LIEDGVTNPNIATNREYVETDDIVIEGDIKLGPLSERFLSCFVPSIEAKSQESVPPETSDKPIIPHIRNRSTLGFMEERLRQELIHIGLYTEEAVEPVAEEDQKDEIYSQILKLQDKLRNVIKVNNQRKTQLRKVCEKHLGYQE
jgi:hypothetical protein